jgi:hypothetical protein
MKKQKSYMDKIIALRVAARHRRQFLIRLNLILLAVDVALLIIASLLMFN